MVDRFAFHILGSNKMRSAGLADLIDGQNIRMVESRGGLRFRKINLTHAAGAQWISLHNGRSGSPKREPAASL